MSFGAKKGCDVDWAAKGVDLAASWAADCEDLAAGAAASLAVDWGDVAISEVLSYSCIWPTCPACALRRRAKGVVMVTTPPSSSPPKVIAFFNTNDNMPAAETPSISRMYFTVYTLFKNLAPEIVV